MPAMPDRLYYYASLANEERKSWLEDMLIRDTVFFRSRDSLNDPNELRPEMVFTGSPEQKRAYVYDSIIRHYPKRLSPSERLLEAQRVIRKLESNQTWMRDMLHGLLDRVGIFCLSESPTIPQLWAHYGDGHRGVCLEFNAGRGLFLAAQQVQYADRAPVIDRLGDGADVIMEKSLLVKNLQWAHEREWRAIARWSDPKRIEINIAQINPPQELASFLREQHGSGAYHIPPEAVVGVIYGSRISQANSAWLGKLLDTRAHPVARIQSYLDGSGSVTLSKPL